MDAGVSLDSVSVTVTVVFSGGGAAVVPVFVCAAADTQKSASTNHVLYEPGVDFNRILEVQHDARVRNRNSTTRQGLLFALERSQDPGGERCQLACAAGREVRIA